MTTERILLQRSRLKRSIPDLIGVKLNCAKALCARQQERDMTVLKLSTSAYVLCLLLVQKEANVRSLLKVAATIACRSDSAQRSRPVLLAVGRPKAVRLANSVPSELIAVFRHILSTAACYKDSKSTTLRSRGRARMRDWRASDYLYCSR